MLIAMERISACVLVVRKRAMEGFQIRSVNFEL